MRDNLPLAPVAGIPGIRLHSACATSGLWRLRARSTAAAPYWAYRWAGGLALAHHILDRPETVAGRRVLDLGAGSGLVGIVAARAGAAEVFAAEVDPWGLAALGLNAAANDVILKPLPGDATAGSPPPVDIVLVGDLFYSRDLAARVIAFLDRCLSANTEVLVGDPRRAFLPVARLGLLAEYPVADVGDARPGRGQLGAVFALEPRVSAPAGAPA